MKHTPDYFAFSCEHQFHANVQYSISALTLMLFQAIDFIIHLQALHQQNVQHALE